MSFSFVCFLVDYAQTLAVPHLPLSRQTQFSARVMVNATCEGKGVTCRSFPVSFRMKVALEREGCRAINAVNEA